jgi:hypothetical protein
MRSIRNERERFWICALCRPQARATLAGDGCRTARHRLIKEFNQFNCEIVGIPAWHSHPVCSDCQSHAELGNSA